MPAYVIGPLSLSTPFPLPFLLLLGGSSPPPPPWAAEGFESAHQLCAALLQTDSTDHGVIIILPGIRSRGFPHHNTRKNKERYFAVFLVVSQVVFETFPPPDPNFFPSCRFVIGP